MPFDLKISGSAEPLRLELLSAGERSRYDRLSTERRRQGWLLGRAALKGLLRQMGEAEETADLIFPNPRYSLTHCDIYAVAVGIPTGCSRGVGVDLELSGLPRPEAARFFLTADEQAWVAGLAGGARGRELQRLWTVKEALFKSDPGNGGRTLADYRIADPAAGSGTAFAGPDGPAIEYASLGFLGGVLSVAVLLNEEVSGCLKN